MRVKYSLVRAGRGEYEQGNFRNLRRLCKGLQDREDRSGRIEGCGRVESYSDDSVRDS